MNSLKSIHIKKNQYILLEVRFYISVAKMVSLCGRQNNPSLNPESVKIGQRCAWTQNRSNGINKVLLGATLPC